MNGYKHSFDRRTGGYRTLDGGEDMRGGGFGRDPERMEGRGERHGGPRGGRFETLPERMDDRGGPRGGRFDTLPERMDDRGGPRGGRFETLPERMDDHGGPRGGRFETLPERMDDRGGPRGGRFETLPERFGGDGRGRGPHRPGGPGFRRGGMPPRRPSPEFMKARIEEADLGELLAMAGRMSRQRPQGDPAQGQGLVLSILAGRDALSQRALQLMLGVQPGSLSELLTKLERKGLVTREKAEDRRGNLLRITDEGRAAIPAAGDDEAADDRFSALTGDQQAQLCELLRLLLNDWAARFDQPPCDAPDGHCPDGHCPNGHRPNGHRPDGGVPAVGDHFPPDPNAPQRI